MIYLIEYEMDDYNQVGSLFEGPPDEEVDWTELQARFLTEWRSTHDGESPDEDLGHKEIEAWLAGQEGWRRVPSVELLLENGWVDLPADPGETA